MRHVADRVRGRGRIRAGARLLLHPRRLWAEHRRVALGLITVVALGFAAVVVAYEVLKRPPDVHNETAIRHFTPEPPKPPPPKAKTVNWPMFGLSPARTRYLPAEGVKPPFRFLWHYTERPLFEFPPIYARGKLYVVNNNGTAIALDAGNGKVLWERSIGRLNASSPAFSHDRLYIVNLVPGHIVKLNAETGAIIWKKALPGRAESSPLVLGNTVYFGCEDGQLFALSTRNGDVRWATTLRGPIKAAPAFRGGILYVGDYGGYMNAVRAATGRLVWQSSSLGTGVSGGEFYSTPAVAFGRVYAGNNDGRVYSYDQSDGTLAWTHSTGGYVYSGPTVASTPSTPPTVYIGSFDGNIYALDAKNGESRWTEPAGGQVVGSLSGVGNIVYAAEFTNGTTVGFDMRTGHRVFRYKTGTYSPVISDGRRIYLVGYSSINALEPVHPRAKKRATPKRSAHRRPTRHARARGARQEPGGARESGSR